MTNFGGATTEIVAKKATISVNSDFCLACKNVNAEWGFAALEEPVNGSDIPRVIHDQFHGEITVESVYSSDETYRALSDNRDTVYTFVLSDYDPSDNSKTATATAMIDKFTRSGETSGSGIIRATLHAVMTALPSLA